MPARLQAALMFWSSSARASIPMRARISCSRAVTVVLLVVRVRLRTPNPYHRSAVGALYAFRPVLSGDLPLNTVHLPLPPVLGHQPAHDIGRGVGRVPARVPDGGKLGVARVGSQRIERRR